MGKLLERELRQNSPVRLLVRRLMQWVDLDSLAGAVAYRHCLPAPKHEASSPVDSTQAFHEASARAGLYLATASADRLDMFGRLNRESVRQVPSNRSMSLTPWSPLTGVEISDSAGS